MHIFISYSKKNKDYAQRLKAKLIEEGFDVWIDDRIDYGDDWWRTIVQAIRNASAFIVIMTDEADSSEWVQREVTLADKHHIPPFPLWLSGDFDKSDNWAIYVRTQYADVRNREMPSSDYYIRLAKVVPPKPHAGDDVTPSVAIPTQSIVETELGHDISRKPLAESILPTTALPKRPFNRLVPIIIIAVVAVIAVAILIPSLNHPSVPTPTSTATQDVFYLTQQAPTATEAAVSHIPPSLTPILSLPLGLATLGYPGHPVTQNADWKPTYKTVGGIQMVLVPVGCFTMGSKSSSADQRPTNKQCFEQPFWIDRYEVTNNKYGSSGNFKGSTQPRDSVSWSEAKDFCAKRGSRLPTEREWEYAARGPSNLLFPWGNNFVYENLDAPKEFYSPKQTVKVGSYPSGNSWIGASDMSGNLWEWVSSIYKPYPYEANDGREADTNTTSLRVLRGGSWNSGIANLGSTYRSISNPATAANNFGFRCARDFQESDLSS